MSQTLYLDPLSKKLADSIPEEPAIEDLSVEETRKMFAALNAGHVPPPEVERESFDVPVFGGVKTWIYKPQKAKGPLPFIFYIHGGAWILGNAELYDSVISDLVLRTDFALIFPEYTLAPDAKFPLQHEQCYAVLQWTVQHAKSKGLMPENFAVVGDSAGGHIAFGVNVLAQTREPHLDIPFNVLICPVTDTDSTDRDTDSQYQFFNGPFLTVPFMRKCADLYIPHQSDRETEIGSPRYVTDETAKNFPPTLVVLSSADLLCSEGVILADKLQAAGRDVVVVRGEGQLHDTVCIVPTRVGPTPQVLVSIIAAQLKLRVNKST